MTDEEYNSYLSNLKKKNEIELYSRCLQKNPKVINSNGCDEYRKSFAKLVSKKAINEKFINEYNIMKKMNEVCICLDVETYIKSINFERKEVKFNETKEKRKIYEYVDSHRLCIGDVFGEKSLGSSSNKR
jgi:hypothetical protein